MTGRVLVDTGPIVAVFSRADQYHAICTEQLRSLRPPLYTCWPVITEAAYLLRRDAMAVQRLLGSFEVGLLSLLSIDANATTWLCRFMEKYGELNPQLADACLMYLAEREGIETIFTLDRRDFGVFRFDNGRSPILLPASI